jgi:DNA uptake protein ComE-like DNA-binding protein
MKKAVQTAGLALAVAALASGALAQPAPDDPNAAGVKAVCGRCHDAEKIYQFPPQSWDRWNAIFGQMVRLGAKGSNEELQQVQNYILDHHTVLNVNTGSADELQWVLNADDAVVQAIIARRAQKPFRTPAELQAIPGVDGRRVDLLKDRLTF